VCYTDNIVRITLFSHSHFLGGGGGGGGDGRTFLGGAGFALAPSLNPLRPASAGGRGGGGFEAFLPIIFFPCFI